MSKSSQSSLDDTSEASYKMFYSTISTYDMHGATTVPGSFTAPSSSLASVSPPNALLAAQSQLRPPASNFVYKTEPDYGDDENRRQFERFFVSGDNDGESRHKHDYSDEYSPEHDLDIKFDESMFEGPPIPLADDAANQASSRYEVIMEAPTAAAQRIHEGPLTYLNKGQYYAINFSDKLKKDVNNNTAVRIRFHEQQHQLEKTDNWRTWLSQQPSRAARPIEIDKLASTGIRQVDTSEFDTIRFQWNGLRNAKVLIRLNCLSTEFSRTKGVKGIQLRLQVETEDDHGEHETAYCRVKIFRDKGAQRKNRDDQRAVEKKLEKLLRDSTVNKNGKSKLETFQQHFTSSTPSTRFTTDYDVMVSSPMGSNDPSSPASSTTTDNSKNRARKFDYIDLAELEIEPSNSITLRKKKKPLLCLLIKTPDDPMYSGVFLEKLTLEDLRAKIAERYNLELQSITSICRITKKGLPVKVDDKMVESFEEEQDFIMESQFNNVDGTITINLR